MSDRKRAIETLKQLRLDYEEFYEEHNNEVTQAYDMAISSLETDEAYQLEYESTTKNDLGVDAVSRQAINGYIDYILSHGMGKKKSFDFIKKFVANLPPVTPIRPKGHWIETAEDYYKAINEKGGGVNESTDYFTDDIACSECLAKFSVIDNEADRFDFCPCCGSDNR